LISELSLVQESGDQHGGLLSDSLKVAGGTEKPFEELQWS